MEGSNKAPCGNGFISFGNKVNVCKLEQERGKMKNEKTKLNFPEVTIQQTKKYKQIHLFNNFGKSHTACWQNVPIRVEAQTY